MHWSLLLVIGAIAGIALGTLFFGGLWWTSRRLVDRESSPGLVAVSFVARMALLAAGLIGLSSLHPLLLIGTLPGLITARVGWTRTMRPIVDPSTAPAGQGV